MTPEQLTMLTQLVGLIERVSNWPFASLLLVLVVGPWVMSLINSYTQRRQLDQAVQMYKDNVNLVKSWERLADDQKDIITLNTQAWIGVRDAIQRNEFCPVVRAKHTSRQSILFETDKEDGD